MPSGWNAPQAGTLVDQSNWWTQFDDPALSTLIAAAQKDNPTLEKAAAAIEKARASRESAQAGFFPEINANADAVSSGSFKNGSGTTRSNSAGLDASWELDLFGRTRRSTESATALLEARESDWNGSLVSLAAEVASDYIQYRAGRIKQKYYEKQAESQAKTSELTQLSVKAGFTAPADGQLAEASAASTRSTALNQKAECEVLIKSLVALTGMEEAELRTTLSEDLSRLPGPEGFQVTEVPANLLRQRPDILSAERELASASALIGVAEAARWPSLTLSGSVTLTATRGAATTAPWSFGPALTLPIFDGGNIRAGIKSAKADYDSAYATYKQTVRDAVKEVEQALVRLDSVAQRETEEQKSAQGYSAYLTAVEQNWRTGGASLLDLETARRSAIVAEVSLLELQENRLLYWIALYKAVGGGWQAGCPGW
jgi:NodT family efflux transporter outer membrane factor (OMF) lipoprotein